MSQSPNDHSDPQGETESRYHPITIYDSQNVWDDDDDDDMEYQPSREQSEDIELFEDDEDDEDGNSEYFDGAEDLSGVDVEFTLETSTETQDENEGDDTETERDTRPAGNVRTTQVTSAQIISMLGANGLRRILQSHGLRIGGRMGRLDDDDEENEDGYGGLPRRRRKTASMEDKFPKVPSENGKRLMESGIYGSSEYFVDARKKRKTSLGQRLIWREMGSDERGAQKRANKLMAQTMIPSSTADKIIHYDSRCYSGQFSDDGNFFFSCAQDFKVRMYDTSNPYDWRYYKTVNYPYGQWTITDASLSPDNRYLAYSSIRHCVCLAPTDPGDHSEPMSLDFMKHDARSRGGFHGSNHFGIWSIRFSGDGRELVAGTSDRSVVVYDIETQKSILQLQNHDDDVNAVCFGDTSSPHILYSGSDDTTLRVWDRRSMGDGREAGVFMGHTEGLTYVDSKGDGRYVLSNGKDQMMKLWDLRKMMTTAKFDRVDPNKYTTGFDYRFMSYADEEYQPHPHDCSVVTFRGHRVLKTLIRCHFSPPGSTNSKYVYSGSEDGMVYIYNLDATLAGKIDVAQASHQSRPRHPDLYNTSFEMSSRGRASWKTCVRDASWHPTAPVIAATSWNGWGMATGTCTVHSWNDGAEEDEGQPLMGMSYDGKLEFVDAYNNQRTRGASGTLRSRIVRPRRQGFQDDDDDDGGLW